MVHRALHGLLAKEGLHEVEADGQFDPHRHEALMQHEHLVTLCRRRHRGHRDILHQTIATIAATITPVTANSTRDMRIAHASARRLPSVQSSSPCI